MTENQLKEAIEFVIQAIGDSRTFLQRLIVEDGTFLYRVMVCEEEFVFKVILKTLGKNSDRDSMRQILFMRAKTNFPDYVETGEIKGLTVFQYSFTSEKTTTDVHVNCIVKYYKTYIDKASDEFINQLSEQIFFDNFLQGCNQYFELSPTGPEHILKLTRILDLLETKKKF